jgi:flavin-dependent dehydrogenase
LIDRDVFPRDKVCGEFLSYDALPLLAALGIAGELDREGATSIDRCRVVGSRATYEFEFPRAARGISRFVFDAMLLRHAEARGAMRLDGWTASAIGAGRLTIQRGDESREIDATTIVGAWGRWGRFDQQLGRAFVRDRAHRSFGFKRHHRSAAPSTSIDLHSFRGGYLGVNAVEGNITNICGLAHAARLAGHKGRWEAFVETIRAESPALDALFASHEPAQEQYLSSEPVIFRARSPVEAGVVMVGDSSGIIDPLTGNGMAMAVQSAFLAAPFLVALAANGADRARLESAYRRAHASFFGPRIAWSRSAAVLLSRPRLLDAAMRAVRTPRVGELLLRKTRATDRAIERLAKDCGIT